MRSPELLSRGELGLLVLLCLLPRLGMWALLSLGRQWGYARPVLRPYVLLWTWGSAWTLIAHFCPTANPKPSSLLIPVALMHAPPLPFSSTTDPSTMNLHMASSPWGHPGHPFYQEVCLD